MNRKNKLVLGLAIALALQSSSLVFAAAKPQDSDLRAKPKLPIIVEADQVYYSDATGDMQVQGNVTLTQGQAKILTDKLNGNSKQSEVWIDGSANFVQQGTNIVGTHTRYNYQDKQGTMAEASGKVDKERVYGHNIDILPTSVIIHDGTITRCPAIVPDYHVSASKVEIWPGDKLIAYNAKFWIKDKVIFTMDKYQKSLKDDDSGLSEFPQVGYNSDGLSIRQHLERPISRSVAVFADINYYSKRGLKPIYGLVHREQDFGLTLSQGEFRDGDGNWVTKQPELRLDYYKHRIGHSPVQYSFTGIYGNWKDQTKTSWHQDYTLYFSRDTINLSSGWYLDLGTGYQLVRESFNGSQSNIFRYDGTLTKVFSPKLSSFVGYHFTRNNNTLFEYNKVDVGRELASGFTYKIDRLNTISYSQSYDLDKKQMYERYYTWTRNLHCWEMSITYKGIARQLTWDLAIARW